MSYRNLFLSAFIVALGSIAIAQQAKDAQPAKAEIKPPPGWTEADMQACMTAGAPGKMHEQLAKSVGVWSGKSTLIMYPGAEPVTSDCTMTVTAMLDGRFIKVEHTGEMPGMGPFAGFGIYGFDNVTKQFVSTWIDSCGTGMAHGTGDLSADGKTLTMNRTYNCPIAKKAVPLRETETITGPNTKTLEIVGADPKSGKEFKMMSIQLTKK